MSKKNLSKLCMLAAGSVAFVSFQNQIVADVDSSQMQMVMQAMSPAEQAFVKQLDANARQMFQNMTNEQRAMCMNMPMHGCKGQNTCKGQGGCKAAGQGCSGRNSCKGHGGCSVDANKAMKMISDKMMAKRMEVL